MKRILDNKFDFNDFLSQYQAMNNMGGTKMMKLIPGFTQVWYGWAVQAGRILPTRGTQRSVSQLGKNICAEQELLRSDQVLGKFWLCSRCEAAASMHTSCTENAIDNQAN